MKSFFFIFLLVAGCGVATGRIREYFFNSTPTSWSDAQWVCRQNYKDLATITSVEENNRLLESGSDSYGSWIGLNSPYFSNTWKWSDGEPVSFLNWYSGYPTRDDLSSTSENSWCNCGRAFDKTWRIFYCSYGLSYYCYRFVTLVKENKTWEEAQEYCMTHHTGLASVTSATSLRQVKLETDEAQTDSVWTGLHFLDGKWLWLSRESLGSLVSMPSCPAPPYRCGSLNITTDAWENRDCNDKLNFLCYGK